MEILIGIYAVGFIIFMIKGSAGGRITTKLIGNSLIWPLWIIVFAIVLVIGMRQGAREMKKREDSQE